jgi:hypothetical protein
MRSVVGTVATAVAVLVTAAVLLVGALAWRLSRGPIDLPSLTPRLEAALSAPDGSAVVRIGSTALVWDPSHRDLGVRARDVQVSGADGRVLATLPVLAIGIAPGALLRGAVMPRSLQAIAPHVELARERDGHIDVGIGGAPAPAVTDLMYGLLGAPRTTARPAVPRRIRVLDGDVSLVDRATGATWHATNVTLSLRPESDGVAVESLAFDLAPAKVVADGRIEQRGRFNLRVTVSGLPTEGLMPYWPAPIAPALRHWVTTNVSGGKIRALHATLAGSLNGTSAPGLTLSSIDGRVRFDGQTVRWLEGMPPAISVAGVGTLSTHGRWQLHVARGEIEGIEIVRTAVTPQPAANGVPGIHVDAVVRGPLSRASVLLQQLPSHLAANLPFEAGDISGGLTARLQTVVPLEAGADHTGLTVRGDGDLRSVAMRKAFRGRTITAPRLRFDLDGRDMWVRGGVHVGRAAAELRWRQTVAGPTRGHRDVVLKGRLDAEGRHALGFDLAPWVDGPIDFQAHLAPHGQEPSDFDLQLNLDHASLDLPLLNMVKDPGTPATSQARLALAAGQVRSVDDFRLQANGSSLGGQATFGPDESWRTVQGEAEIAPRTEGGQPGHVTFAARPAGTESQLTLTSDDPGDMLRTIDAYADATGGRLKFTGTGRLGVPGFPLAGTVKVERFTLTRSPMVAKIAALGSISPIVDALRGDGIPFSQLTASLTHRAGVIVISECTLTGAAVAMALRGTVDRMKDDLSLTGTLVPSYTALSRLTKDVPALGPEPIGGTSNGVRSVDFEVSGSLGDPYVTVKPTSAAAGGNHREGRRSWRSKGGSELRPEAEEKPRPKPKPKPKRRPRPASPASPEPEAQ